jgi:hypothetical protein
MRHPGRRDPEEWDVYALTAGRVPQRFRARGRSVRVMFVGPVGVIVGAHRAANTPTETALREQHAVVLSLADQIDPILPARFGSRMTAERLEDAIRPSIPVLMEALEHVRGRRQMTIRLIGPAESLEPEPAPRTGTAYLARRRAAARRIPSRAAPLRAAVERYIVDERVQQGRGGIHATIFHLIARRDVSAYERAIRQIGPAIEPWRAAMSGPWPAFAFAPELAG